MPKGKKRKKSRYKKSGVKGRELRSKKKLSNFSSIVNNPI